MITTLINQGLALQQQGKLDLALLHFQEAIKLNPQDIATLVSLGNLYKSLHQHEKSLNCFERALILAPHDAGIHYNKANALKALERYEEAIESYERAIELKPDYADAYYNLGNVFRRKGKLSEALAAYEQIHKLNPNKLNIYFMKSQLLEQLGDLEQAIENYEELLKIQPSNDEAYYCIGNIQTALKRYEEALISFNYAIRLNPFHANAYSNRGSVYVMLKQYEKAIDSYNRAINLAPNNAGAYSNRSIALKELGHFVESLLSCDKAIKINPDYIDAHFNRGNTLISLEKYEEAIQCYDRTVELNPHHSRAYSNRGFALRNLNQFDKALVSLKKSLEINASQVEAYNELGIIMVEMAQFDLAQQYFNKAIETSAEDPFGNWNLALLNLSHGRYKEGFKGFEWRWKDSSITTKVASLNSSAHPLWLGQEPLAGKTILLHAEQGLGDVIQFSRYAPMVAKLGAKVTLLVPTVLKDLLSDIDGVHEVIDGVETNRPFDFQCPLMSLPLAFKTELDSIPPPTQNLAINKDKAQYFEQQLGSKTKPRIGICWSSVSSYKGDHKRSLTLEQFLTALPTEGFEYICLQKEIKEIDQELLKDHPEITFFGDQFNDFSDTAALLQNLDLVISVDTSVAHLAASLGKPTWILLPFSPDWRWMLHRSDSPWYPSVTLIRQQSLVGDWGGVLEKVATQLGALLQI